MDVPQGHQAAYQTSVEAGLSHDTRMPQQDLRGHELKAQRCSALGLRSGSRNNACSAGVPASQSTAWQQGKQVLLPITIGPWSWELARFFTS